MLIKYSGKYVKIYFNTYENNMFLGCCQICKRLLFAHNRPLWRLLAAPVLVRGDSVLALGSGSGSPARPGKHVRFDSPAPSSALKGSRQSFRK